MRQAVKRAWTWVRERAIALKAALRAFARRIKRELAVWRRVLADRRTPWYARALLGFGIAYAAMPFDLVPDFIPFVGWLDDVVLVGVPIALGVRLVPRHVLAEARAAVALDYPPPTHRGFSGALPPPAPEGSSEAPPVGASAEREQTAGE
jgi:uncharacterized membrane protein YkvA (DUF1232 family)